MTLLLSLLTGCAQHLFPERVFDCDGVTRLEVRAAGSLAIVAEGGSIPVPLPPRPDEPIDDDDDELSFGAGEGPCELTTDATVRPVRDGSELTLFGVERLEIRGGLASLAEIHVAFEGELEIDSAVIRAELELDDCDDEHPCYLGVTRGAVSGDLTGPEGYLQSRLPLQVTLRDGDSSWCGDRGGSLWLEGGATRLQAGGRASWDLLGRGDVTARLFPGTEPPQHAPGVTLAIEDEWMEERCFGEPIPDPCGSLSEDACELNPCEPGCEACFPELDCPGPVPATPEILITRHLDWAELRVLAGDPSGYRFGVIPFGMADADAFGSSCLTENESLALGLPADGDDGDCVEVGLDELEQFSFDGNTWPPDLTWLVRTLDGAACWAAGADAAELGVTLGCSLSGITVVDVWDVPPPAALEVGVAFFDTPAPGYLALTIVNGTEDYQFGFAQTAVDAQGGDGWFGEDCWLGQPATPIALCHPVTFLGATLTHVGSIAAIVEGSTTLVPMDTPPLTYILIGESSGDCWVWGHDPTYYESFPGAPCGTPIVIGSP